MEFELCKDANRERSREIKKISQNKSKNIHRRDVYLLRRQWCLWLSLTLSQITNMHNSNEKKPSKKIKCGIQYSLHFLCINDQHSTSAYAKRIEFFYFCPLCLCAKHTKSYLILLKPWKMRWLNWTHTVAQCDLLLVWVANLLLLFSFGAFIWAVYKQQTVCIHRMFALNHGKIYCLIWRRFVEFLGKWFLNYCDSIIKRFFNGCEIENGATRTHTRRHVKRGKKRKTFGKEIEII